MAKKKLKKRRRLLTERQAWLVVAVAFRRRPLGMCTLIDRLRWNLKLLDRKTYTRMIKHIEHALPQAECYLYPAVREDEDDVARINFARKRARRAK